MKESSWDECLEFNNALTVTPDRAKAKSLYETAKERIEFLKGNTLSEKNASFVFEGYYSSALETLHSYVLLKGFNVSNHLCLGYYLRDILKRENLFRIFDDCRIKRNFLVYYGKKLNFQTADKDIERIDRLIKEVGLMIEAELNKVSRV